MASIKAWLSKDIQDTYYVSGTYLEDGKSSNTPYPKKYLDAQKELDKIKHESLPKTKSNVSGIIKKFGFTPKIQVDGE